MHHTATYVVQDIIVTVLPNGLAVQCLFAEGSMQHMCTVVLVMNGVIQRRASFTEVMTFPDLAAGSYNILVFDSESNMEDSWHNQIPAIQRTVMVSGESLSHLIWIVYQKQDCMCRNLCMFNILTSDSDDLNNGKEESNSGTPTKAIILTIG